MCVGVNELDSDSTSGRWSVLLGASALAVAVGLSVGIGFVGAPSYEQFDWRLCAEIGTAVGTILLAAYTAWLATTTRREVGLAITDQRARDRPVVIAIPMNVSIATIDPGIGATVPTLDVRLRNVGLGPALDIQIQAFYGNGPEACGNETLAVLGVDELADRAIALTGQTEPEGGFRVEDFRVLGRYHDRTLRDWHPTTAAMETGLRDLQREGARIASGRAALWFQLTGERSRSGTTIDYGASVSNSGLGEARNVTIWLFQDDGSLALRPIEIDRLAGRGASKEIEITLSNPHGPIMCSVQWQDRVGEHQESFGPFG